MATIQTSPVLLQFQNSWNHFVCAARSTQVRHGAFRHQGSSEDVQYGFFDKREESDKGCQSLCYARMQIMLACSLANCQEFDRSYYHYISTYLSFWGRECSLCQVIATEVFLSSLKPKHLGYRGCGFEPCIWQCPLHPPPPASFLSTPIPTSFRYLSSSHCVWMNTCIMHTLTLCGDLCTKSRKWSGLDLLCKVKLLEMFSLYGALFHCL